MPTLTTPARAEPINPLVTASSGSRMTPVFQVELRRRHDDAAPIARLEVRARTMASARHAVRLQHPETVIVSIKRA